VTVSGASLPARLGDFRAFVVDTVHPATARILEVGCGSGALADALAEAGYDVTAVDPNAPDGARFRRGRIEDFMDDQLYDAVVASLSLHHVDDLDATVDRVADLLPPGGPLLVDEFARERFTGATAEWYYLQRRALAAVGGDAGEVPDDFESWQRRWFERHGHIHTLADVRAALARRFDERRFDWRPYLYSYHLDDALEPLERSLIAQGLLTATGCRYLGSRR
jgi:SAM-dependent methyltransferase